MTLLGIGKGPLASWTVTEMLKELGFERALEEGKVKIAPDGVVSVGTFTGDVRTQEELEAMLRALGKVAKPVATSTTAGRAVKPMDVLLRARASQVENRVNERLWMGIQLQTDLKPEYRHGQRFDLPLKRLPPGEGAVFTVGHKSAVVDAMRKLLVDKDGSVLVPVHPQEMQFREMTAADGTIPGVRCASSERTVHAGVPGLPDVMLKLDLAHIMHSMVVRPIGKDAAYGAVKMTEFLMDWIDKNPKTDDAFCFFPEVMAVVDVKADAAAVVRGVQPYPPHPSGKTWTMPAYSLSARDQDFPNEPPPLIRMINDRPDPTVRPVDDFIARFVKPLVESALRVALDLGSACQMHGQNSYLEMGPEGQPTGRVVHGDLEAFWPHPDVAQVTGRDDYFAKNGATFTPALESDISWTFQTYFVNGNLLPLVKCFEAAFPDQADEARALFKGVIKAGVEQRKDVVTALKNGVMQGFARYLT